MMYKTYHMCSRKKCVHELFNTGLAPAHPSHPVHVLPRVLKNCNLLAWRNIYWTPLALSSEHHHIRDKVSLICFYTPMTSTYLTHKFWRKENSLSRLYFLHCGRTKSCLHTLCFVSNDVNRAITFKSPAMVGCFVDNFLVFLKPSLLLIFLPLWVS